MIHDYLILNGVSKLWWLQDGRCKEEGRDIARFLDLTILDLQLYLDELNSRQTLRCLLKDVVT